MKTRKNLYDKLWEAHVVRDNGDGTCLLYIDRHLVHEVTSPQAFAGLRLAGRQQHRLWPHPMQVQRCCWSGEVAKPAVIPPPGPFSPL